jgi:putative tryptophan/tyrosine transport system substrate-binding protein
MRFNHLSRREFVTLLGTATATWPVAARAQQMARTRHIGVLMAWAEDQPEGKAEAGALQDGLSKLGWTAGRNVQIDYRWPGNDIDRIRAAANELVATKPDVLVARSTPETAAFSQATHTIPIVFVGTVDPLGSGFIASLARPGGNATASLTSGPRSAANGSNCSSRFRQNSPMSPSFSMPRRRPMRTFTCAQ